MIKAYLRSNSKAEYSDMSAKVKVKRNIFLSLLTMATFISFFFSLRKYIFLENQIYYTNPNKLPIIIYSLNKLLRLIMDITLTV